MFKQELSKGKRVVVKGGRTSLNLWVPCRSKCCTLTGFSNMMYFSTGQISHLCLEIAEGFMGCFLQEGGKHVVLSCTFVNRKWTFWREGPKLLVIWAQH